MKSLTKLLLIHWHYFTHELIEFSDINFLTGKNTSGKSTIVDALQLVLLGDTSGSYFNKAATKKGERTLNGYLLGDLGDDGESGIRYLRGGTRFTSYIALEFFDNEKQRHFTAGCCFDVYSENDSTKLFFLYDGEMHPQGFLSNGTPMDITALRSFLREQYNDRYETTDVGRAFRTKLYGRLGGLRDRFSELLKKAVSFDPEIDIQSFISDFVCGSQQTVDVSHMQDNIRSYKLLESEASIMQERISLLEQINNTYEKYKDAVDSEMLYSFLIDRASADMKNAELLDAKKSAEETADNLEKIIATIKNIDMQLEESRKQRDTLSAELLSDGTTYAVEQIERQISDKKQQIATLERECEKARNLLTAHISGYRISLEAVTNKVGASRYELLNTAVSSRIGDICVESRNLFERIEVLKKIDAESIRSIGLSGLSDISNAAESLKNHSIELNYRVNDEQTELARRRAALTAELQSLESGMFHFPRDAIDLKDAVASRLRVLAKKDVDVCIVAEVSEIKSDRWRNVIEGYLNTQKYYIIVPREYFRDALRVFDAIKRSKSVYSTGIVDIEKLARINPVADEGSLAEEIETNNADVRCFLDYTLGRVQKCNDVKELRRHRTSITDDGMLYQNFVVRAMNPERWSTPAIGQGAIKRRIEAVREEINVLAEQVAVCASVKTGLDDVSSLGILSNTEIEGIVSCAEEMSLLPQLNDDVVSLQKNLEAIDTTKIDALKQRIGKMDSFIGEQDSRRTESISHKGELQEKLRSLKDEKIPQLTKEYDESETGIANSYDNEWVAETGRPRYDREISARMTAENIAGAFPREQSRQKNIKENAWNNLINFRRDYNHKYKMGYDINSNKNDVYYDSFLELNDIKLPEYQAKISDAKSKTMEQFQEDFISRLNHNIKDAIRQINDLNRVLKGVPFADDTYRFKAIPKPDYKRYYDMIVDEMITQGGYNLYTMQFNEKYREEINELFAIITGDDGTGGDSSEYEKRVREFTDFKTYLTFDLEVEGHDGKSQRLSKTFRKKSGGETQIPFYITVLASFAQLYRAGRDKTQKTSRLIIFDEAFSKMDGERIVTSIELLRKFDLQAILSAPPDKIVEIATLVDRNLCVHREGTNVCVFSFDANQATEYAEKYSDE